MQEPKKVKRVVDPNDPFKDHVWEKYAWEIWLESKGVPLGWWKNTFLEPRVVAIKVTMVFTLAIGIPFGFFQRIDWYYGDTGSSGTKAFKAAKKSGG